MMETTDTYFETVEYPPTEVLYSPSIIVVGADGSMTVYDLEGNITAEDCDTAYSLWVSENGIMGKPIAHYTVTEGILLIFFIVGLFKVAARIFRRRRSSKRVY